MRTCFNCIHCKMDKYYECFCHLSTHDSFCEDGIPVTSDYTCDSWKNGSVNATLSNEEKDVSWISVKDQLPEDNRYVLVYMPEVDYHYAILEHRDKWIDITDKTYEPDGAVTHWQRLPEPPNTRRGI